MKNPVIAVALSGGVDSLVSGFLLKQKYNHVFGIHFITGYEKKPTDIKVLEHQLGFPISVVDLSESFEKKVVQYFIQTYLKGETPNPCIVCNKKIKFGELLDQAKKMGADYLATGHYATIINEISCPGKSLDRCYLEKGKDPLKDQSYFLSFLNSDQLKNIIFPLAGMAKTMVKQIAKDNHIAPAHPSESQDICFIHDNTFSKFILEKQDLTPEPGNILDLSGNVVGRHTGLHQFTIGQRRGINCPAEEPYYVKKIDVKNNCLYVCFKKDLSSEKCKVRDINWNYSFQKTISEITCKIRYSHKGAQSLLTLNGSAGSGLTGTIDFKTPQNAVTPGQAAVFYKDTRVLGAGIIQ